MTAPAASYRVVRLYANDHPREVIATGLTLEAAQAHCNDPQTSSTTATTPAAIARTAARGAWFDVTPTAAIASAADYLDAAWDEVAAACLADLS